MVAGLLRDAARPAGGPSAILSANDLDLTNPPGMVFPFASIEDRERFGRYCRAFLDAGMLAQLTFVPALPSKRAKPGT